MNYLPQFSCRFFVFSVLLFLLSLSCNKKEGDTPIAYADDMYLYLYYEFEGDPFEVCGDFLEVNSSCTDKIFSKFRVDQPSNQIYDYVFDVKLPAQEGALYDSYLRIELYNIIDIVGSHNLGNAPNVNRIVHDYRVVDWNTTEGVPVREGLLEVDRISDQTYTFLQEEYRVVYGSFTARIDNEGSEEDLVGYFQLPFRAE